MAPPARPSTSGLDRWILRSRHFVLSRAAALIVVIAVIDWRLDVNISFGFLYLFPMLMVGSIANRVQIAAAAALCTILDQWFDPFPFVAAASVPQAVLVFAAFLGAGLFAYEVVRNRKETEAHLERLQTEMAARAAAEEQLQAVIESSPAAVITIDEHGRVLLANQAAHRLVDLQAGELAGKRIARYLPTLSRVPSLGETEQVFHTAMRCRGTRDSGEVFFADVWFSTYRTASGPRLAAMIVDSSEELREREESGLNQLLAGSRILVSAVWHEIRNVCGAISVVYANLLRSERLAAASDDLRALGTLAEGLNRIAATELRYRSRREDLESIDLSDLLDELRVVVEPSLRESAVELGWHVPATLPRVLAERQSLLQVMLNIIKNSERALQDSAVRELNVLAEHQEERVFVRIEDTGPGVKEPEKLFQAFQPGADAIGLGLFLSRAFMRSFQGDVLYEPRVNGSCFVLELIVPDNGLKHDSDAANAHSHSAA